jgi:hypothetical protein
VKVVVAWLSTHRSLVLSAVSGAAITALVATLAVVSTGYTTQRLDLGDGAVWVVNTDRQAIGRANTEVLELNSVIEASASNIDVLQQSSTVLLMDREESKVSIVDPATSVLRDTVALPPFDSELFLAGDRVVVFERGSGELWIVPFVDLPTFAPQSASTLSLGADAVVSVDADGLLFAYAPSVGVVYRLNAAVTDVVESASSVSFGPTASITLTSVSGRWVALDSRSGMLHTDSGAVEMGTAELSGGAVMQMPSTDGDSVLIASPRGLLEVPLSGAPVRELVSGQSGNPARPLIVDDCEFAAWSNGLSFKRCANDQEGSSLSLTSMPGLATLKFRSNGSRVVLEDNRSGASWAVQRSGELIDNWDDLIAVDDDVTTEEPSGDSPPEVEKTQVAPVAVDDSFGARPGLSTVLPVLLNDYDPNGDVLVVSAFTVIDETIGRIDLINGAQQLQLTLPQNAEGTLSFDYSITDGRGGSSSATVSIEVRAADQNAPPRQVRTTTAAAQTGGRVATQVLGDWVDPDGDAFYLTSATVAEPDTVSYKPGGEVVYVDSGQSNTVKIVSLTVSDGTDSASGVLTVDVMQTVPLIVDPFVVLAYAGEEITISPLPHVRGGSGVVRLNSVPERSDVTIVPSYESGSFRFTSEAVRTHYLEIVVTDGIQTVTGLVRVDVASPPTANTKPITIPKTVFVQSLRNERIDVAGTDRDPAGGVLLVTGVMNLAASSGVRAEVLEQRLVRVSLEAPLSGPVSFNYRVSNGLAEAEGVITVIEIPSPRQVQPPIARDDAINVRVGDAIDIPVLANDEHPDGLDLNLEPRLEQDLPDSAGLLFASGSRLRYLAPARTGNFTASYRITGPDGQTATAIVRIAVREANTATNNAPVPSAVTARVLAGETVRITIPLTGIDPDGDSVQLLGQSSNPEMGAVVEVLGDTVHYRAGDYSAGTDSFTYTVIDSLGARATGTVRIGITARLEGARNPVAIADEVTVRPGGTVSVRVLENDSDPDGSPVSIVSVTPNDSVTVATIVDDLVLVTPPAMAGNYGVIYSITNDTGGTSQNFIRVTVSDDAPLSFPVASDTILTLSDILDRNTVTVDVLSRVFFADGDPRSLGLSLYRGYTTAATVLPNKRITVTVADETQIIPFKVTHPEDPEVFSFGFIRVPGKDDALPQLDRRATALTVVSGATLSIDLNEYVIAVAGRTVRLTDSSGVRATHSNGANLVVDSDTLVFTSADRYFGPASIAFEVTDGDPAKEPQGNTAILVLPITVLPRDNQPPVFNGAVLAFEPGQEKVIDLLKLTNYPYPDALNELVFSDRGTSPTDFTYSVSGNLLSVKASDSAVLGASTSLTLGVRDSVSEGKAGRIELSIVRSTRPLVQPAADTVIAKRGVTTTIDVLANDEATNPFPNTPLKVIEVRGLAGAALPPGVAITRSPDSRLISITVQAAAEPGIIPVQYRVADATGDADRAVWSSLTVSIQDRPDAPSALSVTAFGDRELTVRWNAGAFNNSAITNYRVTTTSVSGSSTNQTNCSGTTCVVPTSGNGSANAVRVSVVATNSIGDSDEVTLRDPVWSDVVPAAPTGLTSEPLDRGLRITWNPVLAAGSATAVQKYVVAVGAVTTELPASSCGSSCTIVVSDASLSNGVAIEYRVSARNDSYAGLSAWNTSSGSGTPAGAPIAVASPLATLTGATAIDVGWNGAFSANGRPINNFIVSAYSTSTVPTCSNPAAGGAQIVSTGGTSAQFTSLSADATYSFIVFASNIQGCGASGAVVAHTPPSLITALTFSGPVANGDTFDLQLSGGMMGSEPLTSDYSLMYRLSGGSVTGGERGPIAFGEFLTANGSQYGQAMVVEVRACRTHDSVAVCQEQWSAPITLDTVPVDPRATGVSFTADGDPANQNGTFRWLGLPAGAYESVQFACGGAPGAGSFMAADTAVECSAAAALAGEQPWFTVVVTANGGQRYSMSYNGYDFD